MTTVSNVMRVIVIGFVVRSVSAKAEPGFECPKARGKLCALPQPIPDVGLRDVLFFSEAPKGSPKST